MRIPTFEQLIQMLDEKGVVSKARDNFKEYPFGFRGGNYLGAPGKDIFFVLPSINEEQLDLLANKVANVFPKIPPYNHLSWAAFIRYIYGCFEKQGTLRSKGDKKRMIEADADWSIPIRFMNKVAEKFSAMDNKYGLVIHYEMLAHRYGDRAIIERNPQHLEIMLELYMKAQALAKKAKSTKHTFTPYYWAASYFAEYGDERANKYYRMNLKAMEKYCPDSRDGYKDKARVSILYLKSHSLPDDWSGMVAWLRRCNNKCLKKVIGNIL